MPPSPTDGPAVEVHGIVKRFGDTVALDNVDIELERGKILGFLGPNGAGKTTLVRVLATLLRPDAGRASVFGHDVVAEAATVRRIIGLTGQYAAVDELLTGRENLRMFGRLFHMPASEANQRADELLERFDLAFAADRPARTYSGGMRRRLDLASSLLTRPQLLFLDEPTTGLDPRSRGDIWQVIRELVSEGTTLLLTTQYLEEADQLADTIAVIDHGRIIAEGTGDELKSKVGGQVVEVVLDDPTDRDRTLSLLSGLRSDTEVHEVNDRKLHVAAPGEDGVRFLAAVARVLAAENITLRDLGLHRPTLDDVFLELTGHGAAPTSGQQQDAQSQAALS